jgi:glucose/mannose-6-phosphate isomerase
VTDSLGYLDAVTGLPEQLDSAHELAASLDLGGLPGPGGIDSIAVLGMGGSGIAGDVLAAVGSSLPAPVVVLRQYRTPAFIGPRTLVFAMSYSGDTEETVSMTRGAFHAEPRWSPSVRCARCAGGAWRTYLSPTDPMRGGDRRACRRCSSPLSRST